MNICILTSGGDAPGMNAAIRSVVRSSIQSGHKVFGALNGYEGLIENNMVEMQLRSVANIIHRGGTILKSSRCEEFKTKQGREKAYKSITGKKINALVALGGNGTINGLKEFYEDFSDIKVMGIPCTIDNDCEYSQDSIGFSTATETAVQAIDKIRDTANSHQRTFVIEVMGRKYSELAYKVALSAGAEFVVDLNDPESLKNSLDQVRESIGKGKKSSLIIALENESFGVPAAVYIRNEVEKKLNVDCRSVVLGHLQRGGSPTPHDRYLASLMGYRAVQDITKRDNGVVVYEKGEILSKSFDNLTNIQIHLDELKKLLSTLAN